MKIKFILSNIFVVILSIGLSFCNDNSTLTNPDIDYTEPLFEEYFVNNIWQVEHIFTKHGTHDPDEEVSEDNISRIETQNRLDGEIHFSIDSIVVVNNNSDEFYLRNWNGMKWRIDDDFIYFKYSYGGFGYNIKSHDANHMIWYSKAIGIESGSLSVSIIEFKSK